MRGGAGTEGGVASPRTERLAESRVAGASTHVTPAIALERMFVHVAEVTI